MTLPASREPDHDQATARPRRASPPAIEHTHWSWGLVGFYLSCAGTALGATFASAGYLFFGSRVALVLGIVLATVSIVTCYVSLVAARRKPAA